MIIDIKMLYVLIGIVAFSTILFILALKNLGKNSSKISRIFMRLDEAIAMIYYIYIFSLAYQTINEYGLEFERYEGGVTNIINIAAVFSLFQLLLLVLSKSKKSFKKHWRD